MKFLDTKLCDLNTVAKCHMAAFPQSLSTKLGRSYCLRLLSWYIESKRGLIFHLADEDKLIGYCGGIVNRIPSQHGSTTSMIQYTFGSLVLNLIIRPWLVFHPELLAYIPLIIKNIKLRFAGVPQKKFLPPSAKIKEFIPSMGLVVIGVSPIYQGKGYGSLLLKEFEKRAREDGFRRIHLSVRKKNYQAIAAYKKNGWMIDREGKNEFSMYKEIG
jgi:GNAT superfamily N-acetyltransferase